MRSSKDGKRKLSRTFKMNEFSGYQFCRFPYNGIRSSFFCIIFLIWWYKILKTYLKELLSVLFEVSYS